MGPSRANLVSLKFWDLLLHFLIFSCSTSDGFFCVRFPGFALRLAPSSALAELDFLELKLHVV